MLGVSTEYIAFAGKSSVYCRSLGIVNGDTGNNGKNANGNDESAIDHPPGPVFPEDWKGKNCHVECISVSTDGSLLAVADSSHGLNIFERKTGESEGWVLLFTGVTEKRVIRLQFPNDDYQYLTFLDKQGDIFAIRISADHKEISKMKKLMGHTSFISDYITRVQSQQIISCDRDEKIRISNFPDAFTIQGFKLGHTESVISMALFEQHGYLLTISVAGTLILWDSKKEVCGTSTEFLQKWEIKNLVPDMSGEEITSMRGCSNENTILISVTYRGLKTISVLEIQPSSMKVTFNRQCDTQSDVIFMEWKLIGDTQKRCLIVFEPLAGSLSLKSWMFSKDGDVKFHESNDFSQEMIADINALGETQKQTVVPMKRRQTRFEDTKVSTPPQKV